MARFVTHVHSPWPVEKAFAYMADLTNFAHWDPGVRRAEYVSADGQGSGQPELGAEYEVEVDGIGGPISLIYRLTEYRSPEEVVAIAETRLLRSYDRIVVKSDDGGGSLVTYDAELTLQGIFGLVDPLLGLAFNRIGRKAEQGLIEALEGELATSSNKTA